MQLFEIAVKTMSDGFCPKALEMFFLKSWVYLTGNRELLKIMECVMTGNFVLALVIIKVMRNREGTLSHHPMFRQVELLVYSSICPHLAS